MWPVFSVGVLQVALLAEGVDRNDNCVMGYITIFTSPSSRRAWIEISALYLVLISSSRSPSSRRAWIEMALNFASSGMEPVALLAEGVDRNCCR